MNIDFSYLAELGPKFPRGGVRWGCAFDGQRLALVGYAVCTNGNHVPIRDEPGVYQAEKTPLIFYATTITGCSITRAVRVFDQIAQVTGLHGMSLVVKGSLGPREVFVRHLAKHTQHRATLFAEGQGRYFDEVEVLGAVKDDQDEGVIRLADEFLERPERLMLDEEIGLIELNKPLTPLQEAHLYGLGQWSCKERRAKWTVGPLKNFRLY